ncbi:MAG: hypothetical protein JG775_2539 [Defluviitaleaceae bacterium]|nr:hypothetical protein [Defluviitaleaceae bacterium]
MRREYQKKMKFKENKLELIILTAVLIIGSGILYYKYVLCVQIQRIKQLNTDIKDAKYTLELKNIELKKVNSLQNEISHLDTRINAFKLKIIPYHETAQKLVLLQNFITLSNLTLEKIELKEPTEKALGDESLENSDVPSNDVLDQEIIKYGELFINLELFGSYEDLRVFIEQIGASVKPFVINTIEITPREKGKDSEYQEDEVQAKIELLAYILLNPSERENSNYNFMEYEYKYKNPFKPMAKIENKFENQIMGIIEEKSSDLKPSDLFAHGNNVLPLKVKDFKIAVKDIYASGDNFYIVGPGNKGEYTTLQARTISPVSFYLTLNPTGYEYFIETKEQGVKSFQKKMVLDQCRVIVDSTVMAMRNNQELNTCIFIQNNTEYPLQVLLKGSYLDKIHIYTKNGFEIKAGEIKENIQVTIVQ